MPGNYPRTVNDRFRRGLDARISAEDRRLGRIERIISGRGHYYCSSFIDAMSLAGALNDYESQLAAWNINRKMRSITGFYQALQGPPPMVIYTNLVLAREAVIDNLPIDTTNFRTKGFEPTELRGEDDLERFEDFRVNPKADSLSYSTSYDFRRAKDEILEQQAEMFGPRHREPEPIEDKFVDTTKRGRVDLNRIDDLTYRTTYDAETGDYEGLDPSSYCSAFLERMNPRSLMPNFDGFGRASDIPDEAERAERYIDFTENHARMMEASQISGLGMDVESMIHDVVSAVKTAGIFSDPRILETIERGNEIEISKRHLGKFIFFDPEPHTTDVEDVVEFKKQMRNADLAYLPPSPEDPSDSGTMFISMYVDRDTFVNGGYYHDKFHGQLRQQHEAEYVGLERKFGMQENIGLTSVVRGFEEVVAHKKAFDFMEQNTAYVEQAQKKYRLFDLSNAGIDRSVFPLIDGLSEDRVGNFSMLVEMLGTFKNLDESTYDKLVRSIEAHKHEFDSQTYDLLFEISNLAASADSDSFIHALTEALHKLGGGT